MNAEDPKGVVLQFNERINAADLDGLAALMTDDHRFLDSAGTEVVGREDCLAAWREFFKLFPDYRNDFHLVAVEGNQVIVLGASTCSDPRLEGPAMWTALTREGRVREWRVHEDTPANRASVGFDLAGAAPVR